MKERLFKLLGIEPGEESMVSMLLAQSIFLGIFFGAFDISAHSLFLSVFDEKAMARAYVISGLVGIILTSIYTFFQARMRFKNFATANLVFVTIITFLLWIAMVTIPGKIVTFAVFVMLGPLNILAVLGFWGTTGRLFTLRQGKRLFGLVDAGLIIGIIISCYAIPVLLSIGFKAHNILLTSTSGVLVAVIIQVLIGRKFTFVTTETPKSEKRSGLSIFRKDSYIRIMGAFVALSVMTAFFVQYSFMAVTRLQYPLEEDMARFLGLFTGSMMIFTLLVKLLLFSYLIRNYGLKVCLALSPILIAGFTALAIILGFTRGFASGASTSFMIFFLILALSRLFSKSLKDSIESPAFKVIYQTVDEKIRYEVQSGIDGTVNEISALSSGLFLAGLGALSFITLIHFSWVLFIIIGAWVLLSFRLYLEYRNSIKKSLEEADTGSKEALKTESWETLRSPVAGMTILKNNYYSIIIGDYSVIEKNNNNWFFKYLIDQAELRQDLSMTGALKKIAARKDIDETIRYRAVEVIDQFDETGGDPRKLRKKLPAVSADEKIINARKVLSDSRVPQTTEILRLLRSNNIEAKRCAVYMIGKFSLTDMIPEVCNCLGIHGLENDSLLVLESFGTKAFDDLFRLYLGSSGNINISKSIINLLGNSCEKSNTDFLFARLWSNSRRLRELAAKRLVDCGYRAGSEERDKLHQLVSDIMGMITWNIAAQSSLSKTGYNQLADVIRKETISWTSFLFEVLSITYDRTYIEKIKANIEIGTVGSVNYALEMIDIVVDDSIKPKLVSLIDVVPDEDKLKTLQHYYPGEIQKPDQLFDDILNRDYNLLNVWVKACTLRTIDKIAGESLRESVIALLFSPEKLLREEAARLIGRTDRILYDEVSSRLRNKDKKALEKIITGEVDPDSFLFEKVTFLSSLFPAIPEDELVYLAAAMECLDRSELDKIKGGEDYILWQIRPESEEPKIKVVLCKGKIEAGNELDLREKSKFYFLPLFTLEEFRNMFPERLYDIYYRIDKSLNNILASR